MGDAARRAHRLDVEALLEILEPVPKSLPPAEDDGDDRNVQMVDEDRGEELTDG